MTDVGKERSPRAVAYQRLLRNVEWREYRAAVIEIDGDLRVHRLARIHRAGA